MKGPGRPIPRSRTPIRSATSISTIARLIGSPTRRHATRSSSEVRGRWDSAPGEEREQRVAGVVALGGVRPAEAGLSIEHVVEPLDRDVLRVAEVEADPD